MNKVDPRKEAVDLFEQYLLGKETKEISQTSGRGYSRVIQHLRSARRILVTLQTSDNIVAGLSDETVSAMLGAALPRTRSHLHNWTLLIKAFREKTNPDIPKVCKVSMEDDITALGMTVRTNNVTRQVASTIGELVKISPKDFLAIPHSGRKCLADLEDCLAVHGLSLASRTEQVSSPITGTMLFQEKKWTQIELTMGDLVRTIYNERKESGNLGVTEKEVAEFLAGAYKLSIEHIRVTHGSAAFDRAMVACLHSNRGIDPMWFEMYMSLIGKKKITITVE